MNNNENNYINPNPNNNPGLGVNETNNNVNPDVLVNQNPAVNNTPSVNENLNNNVAPGVDTISETPSINQLSPNDLVMEKPNNEVLQEPKVSSEESYKSVSNTPINSNNINNSTPINNAPMPGFESSNVVGTIPPPNVNDNVTPNLENNIPPKKKGMNKILFVIIVLVLLAGVGFGTYYVLNYTNLINKSKEASITLHDVSLNVGDSISTNISDYGTIENTSESNCVLDTSKVDTDKEGSYMYTVKCGELIRSANVNVVDNSPLVVGTKDAYVTVGKSVTERDFIIDYDNKLTYSFKDSDLVKEYVNTEGEYDVVINTTSLDGKETSSSAKLYVLPYDIKGYIKCSSKEQNVSGSSATKSLLENIAISLDNNNSYVFGGIAKSTYTFKYTDETEYTSVKKDAKTSSLITIDKISGVPEFDDDNLTVTISVTKNRSMLVSEIGEANLVSYSTIMSYYKNSLAYSCMYE